MAELTDVRTVGPHRPAHVRRVAGLAGRYRSHKPLPGPALSTGRSLPQRIAVWSVQHRAWAVAAWLVFVLATSLAAAGMGLWQAALPASADQGLIRPVMVLMGIAVGVGYVLVYWRRFDEELRTWGDGLTAIEAAANTAGRSVMVSGVGMVLTFIAMLSLNDAGISRIGAGAILVVLVMMAFALMVLPPLMTALAKSPDRPRLSFLARPGGASGSRVVLKLIDQVAKHPAVWLAVGLAFLGLSAIPALDRLVRLPDAAAQVSGAEDDVDAATAENIENLAPTWPHLAVLIAIVAAVMLAVMGLVYRSLAIGLATAILNMVTAAAACGVMTLVFGRPIASAANGTASVWALPLLFVLLCGLSLNYREIILSRIQEEVAAGMDSREAVHSGLVRTASVVTNAAAVTAGIAAILGILGRGELRQIGLGLVVGIGLDATVVRIVALPAFMILADRFLWWPGLRSEATPPRAVRHTSDADTNTEELDVIPDPTAALANPTSLPSPTPAALESSSPPAALPAAASSRVAQPPPSPPQVAQPPPSSAAVTSARPITSVSDTAEPNHLDSIPSAALPIPSEPSSPVSVDPSPAPTAPRSGLPTGSPVVRELVASPSPARPARRQTDWWTDPDADGWTPQSLAAAEWRRSRPWLIGQVLVDVENLTAFQDARPAAESVSFQVRSAEVLALIGPPDGGAAAVGRVLAGRGVARKGTVTVLGETIPTGARVPGDRIVSVPADAVIDSGRSVWDNLTQALARAGTDRADQPDRLAGLVDRFRLSDVVNVRASRLDKADRKLLGLAACVAARPRVAVFAAPTADLNLAQRLAVEEAIAELAWAGAGIVIVPTTAEEAETLASTVLVIGQTVMAHGSIADLLKRFAPASDLTVTVRSVADLSQLAALLTRMGVADLQIDPQTRTVKAALTGGADGLAQVIFRIKVAAIDTVAVSLTTPSLSDALATILSTPQRLTVKSQTLGPSSLSVPGAWND